MARLPRIVVPGQPLHIVQRGNNRIPCFFTQADYHYYLNCLADAAARYGCRIHAFVLMTNHVHLLLTPETCNSASLALQSVGRRYVRYVNKSHRRTGTLWEGRYKSTLIDSEQYLLTCSRYIELNPVRARMVLHPRDYRWSSYGGNAEGTGDAVISPHAVYLRLGTDAGSCAAAYRTLFSDLPDESELAALRTATDTGMVLGNDRFRIQIESIVQRPVERLPAGGDRKSVAFKQRRPDLAN